MKRANAIRPYSIGDFPVTSCSWSILQSIESWFKQQRAYAKTPLHYRGIPAIFAPNNYGLPIL